MPTAARFGGSRIWLWSAAFALWVVVWPGVLLHSIWSTPQFVADMVEKVLGLTYAALLLRIGLIAFVSMWLLLWLRDRLDVGGTAREARRWSLSSPSLNAVAMILCLALSIGVLLLAEAFMRAGKGPATSLDAFWLSWWWVAVMVCVPFLLLVPFCVVNPDTLRRERLQQWWRPSWPGALAVILAPFLWFALPTLADAALSWLPDSLPAEVLGAALSWVFETVTGLIALALWLNRSRVGAARAAIRRMATPDFLRSYLALCLGWGAVMLYLVIPLLVLYVFAIYIAPEYDPRQGSVFVDPAPIRFVRALSQSGGLDALQWPLIALQLFLALSTGRLLIRLGLVPAAPTDGGSSG